MKVFITTHSTVVDPRPASFVFNTIRVGFPNAEVICYWNGGLLSVRDFVEEKCKETNCRFVNNNWLEYKHGQKPADVFNRLIEEERGQIVFLDPDVIFWNEVESFETNSLIAGRYIPQYVCPYTHITNRSRIHPSLFFIRDTEELVEALPKAQSRHTPIDYCAQAVLFNNVTPIFYDTLANLSHAPVSKEYFEESMLDRYDHMFCSSFVDEVAASTPELKHLPELHKQFYNNPSLMKGIWKQQEEYFKKHASV